MKDLIKVMLIIKEARLKEAEKYEYNANLTPHNQLIETWQRDNLGIECILLRAEIKALKKANKSQTKKSQFTTKALEKTRERIKGN